jgi:hypothetical protein
VTTPAGLALVTTCLIGAAGLISAACSGQAPDKEVPAVLIAPSAEARAELAAAVSTALSSAPVTLAADALTDSSLLTIEQQPLRGNPAATGRQLGTAERFRLVTDGEQCTLVHETGGGRYVLAASTCVAERQ